MLTPAFAAVHEVEKFGVARLMGLPRQVQRLIAGPPIVLDGQELDVETQMMLRLKQLLPSTESGSVERGRKNLLQETRLVGGRQPIGSTRELEVAGGDGPIPARLYVPRAGSDALLVYVHGGGWSYGDLDTHDAVCRSIAEHAGVRVLSLDYRRAPEAPFPAAYDDVTAAFRWVVEHLDSLGATPDRLAIGGDSAGGALAAATALMAAREELPLAFQLLVYPATDLPHSRPSHEKFGQGFYLTTEFKDRCRAAYLPDEADWKDPRASVLYADIPDGVAPAYLCTAGFDPLRDEGEEYAQRLADAGVEVELHRFPGLIHGFFNIVGVGRSSREAHLEVVARLRAALSR